MSTPVVAVTYWQYHLIFNLPAFLLLLFLLRRRLVREHVLWISVVAVVAFIATAPWDNLAVHRGIWGFDWERATPVVIPFAGTDWTLPLEEYAFFVFETVLVGMLTLLFLPKPDRGGKP